MIQPEEAGGGSRTGGEGLRPAEVVGLSKAERETAPDGCREVPMIGYWHMVPLPDGQAQIALGAHVGGHELIVERCRGERCWHWMVLSSMGHEIEAGTAPDAHQAEQLAEDAAFHIHPPCSGDWIGRLLV